MTDKTFTLRLDVALLRRQRDWLLELTEDGEIETLHMVGEHRTDAAEGLVSLCDELLDQAEGFR
jgi:hypothetical protein